MLMLRFGLGTRLGVVARLELVSDLAKTVVNEAWIRWNEWFPD